MSAIRGGKLTESDLDKILKLARDVCIEIGPIRSLAGVSNAAGSRPLPLSIEPQTRDLMEKP